MVSGMTTTSTREADDFVAAWEAFALATRRARARFGRDDGIELTPSQLHLVDSLGEGDVCTVGRLAKAAGVSAPTATRMLDGLERGGVVERSADGADRRCVNVFLTAPGRDLVRRKRAAVAGRRAELFTRLDAGEAEDATRLLGRLAELIDEL